MCYGRDLATGRPVEVGEAVGIIAAQSIGEPGTQLTMRTFHTGGVAGQYLTGVANVKDQRVRTLQQILDDVNRGRVQFEHGNQRARAREADPEDGEGDGAAGLRSAARRRAVRGAQAEGTGDHHRRSTAWWRRSTPSAVGARVVIHYRNAAAAGREYHRQIAGSASAAIRKTDEVLVEAGKELTPPVVAKLRQAGVGGGRPPKSATWYPTAATCAWTWAITLKAGNPLTEGPLDPQELLRMRGPREVQEYLVQEIQRVYRSQGVDINDKHVETIVRQMLRKRKVTEPGDTDFLPGQVVDRFEFEDENRRIREAGGIEAQADWVLLGITEASLATDSFLSAASFQKTTRVLTDAAIKGKVDHLIGLKENVIIGRLIPAGTGMDRYRAVKVLSPGGEIKLFEPEVVIRRAGLRRAPAGRVRPRSAPRRRRCGGDCAGLRRDGAGEDEEEEEDFGNLADLAGFGFDDEPQPSDDAEI